MAPRKAQNKTQKRSRTGGSPKKGKTQSNKSVLGTISKSIMKLFVDSPNTKINKQKAVAHRRSEIISGIKGKPFKQQLAERNAAAAKNGK